MQGGYSPSAIRLRFRLLRLHSRFVVVLHAEIHACTRIHYLLYTLLSSQRERAEFEHELENRDVQGSRMETEMRETKMTLKVN
jgi:hypothetical protein